MDLETYKIQKLILRWMSLQTIPVKAEKIRDVCNVCAFSVKKEKTSHAYYRYFLPLLNSGIIEGVIHKRKVAYLFSPPKVFFSDIDNQRYWIGINLSSTLQQQIPTDFEFQEDAPVDVLEDIFIRWVSPKTYNGNGLPIVNNPPATKILQIFPECTPSFFAKEEYHNIADFKQIYVSAGDTRWKNVKSTIPENGLYRQSDQVYSQRIYFCDGQTYTLDKNNPDADSWAKIMHHLDHGNQIGTYKQGTVKFRENLPIVLARVLMINQMFHMFHDFDINFREYRNINPDILRQLQRIFKNKITEK